MAGMVGRPGEAADLSRLSNLSEAILLEELKARYSKDTIYTYVGDILIALNPFRLLPLYSQEFRKRYRNARQSQNPPHIFAIADAAYRHMQESGRSQCCVISGESGAGKTESAKLIVSQLMELSQTRSVLEQKILEVNPLLEAFGNAKTVYNNNSSRFGKYLQLKFNSGQVTGAKINEYLLEKSRVVSQSSQEQNFHIFYYLMSGMSREKKEVLGLTHLEDYQYCGGSSSASDAESHFSEVCNALDLVGFEGEFQEHIFTCLAAVLHIGNIEFMEDQNEHAFVLEPRSGPIQMVSKLLGVDVTHMVELMTTSISFARGETIRRHLTKQSSLAARDAIAKAIYDRLFRWIINKINQLLAPTATEMVGEREISILDIFGFEKFEKNSFEQMCINLANEQLHHFFTEHVFTLEKEEFKKESLGSLDINCHDNKPLLDLFLSKPVGILALLDEQCSFPQATDKSFVMKLCQTLKKKKSSLFVPSKDSNSTSFSIVHYAGMVEYSSDGFLDKNKDTLPGGSVETMRTATNDLLKLLFTANISKTGTLALSRLTAGRLRKKGRESRRGVPMATSRPPTIGAQFKNSLSALTGKMDRTNPHFVHCFKPNTLKVPGLFDMDTVVTQLRYTGMLETTRLRRQGYAFRPPFKEFLEKYKVLSAPSKSACTDSESCKRVLQKLGVSDYLIGKTKVFLKHMHLEELEVEFDRHNRAVTSLQKVVRGFLERCKFEGLLSLKREQQRKVEEFLFRISLTSDDLILQQLNLCDADDAETPCPSAPPQEYLVPATPPSAPPLSEINYKMLYYPLVKLRLKPLPPPPDINAPPPEPALSDSELEEGQREEVAIRNDNTVVVLDNDEETVLEEDGDTSFIAPARNSGLKTFGREGTKIASVRWYKETQAHLLRKSSTDSYPDWFHGFIPRRHSEEVLLSRRKKGTFLVRVCENRFGFSLSVATCTVRSHDHDVCSVVHHMISQLETGKYVVIGEPKVHSSLHDLLLFHSMNPIKKYGGLVLTSPCARVESCDPPPRAESCDLSRVQSHDPPPCARVQSGDSIKAPPTIATSVHSNKERITSESGQVPEERSKKKLSRTRSHDPQLGYGMLGHHITKKS